MRLNEKTYPVLAALDNGNKMKVELDEFYISDLFLPNQPPFEKMGTIDKIIESAIEVRRLSKKTYYLTDPFLKAIEKAQPKIVKDNLHIDNKLQDCGTLLFDKGTVVYALNPTDNFMKISIFGTSRTGLSSYAIVSTDGKVFGNFPTMRDGIIVDDQQMLNDWVHSILVVIYFIHNCEIETRELKPNEKYRDKGVKYFNESKSNVVILDCSWFTELIRNTPFTVNGFLRWQPVGEGRNKKKLIWVEPFTKKGYYRKAKKESNV